MKETERPHIYAKKWAWNWIAESGIMRSMAINMEEAKLQTLAQTKAFLEKTTEVAFRISKDERNQLIERVFKLWWKQFR